MGDLSVHNVKSIEIEKHDLNSGVWVCTLNITCESKIDKQESVESITLFSESLKVFDEIGEGGEKINDL